MTKNSLKRTYDTTKIKSIMREVDAIEGIIDENKKEELKSKYPGFRSLNLLINNHNSKFSKNKPKKKPFRNNHNIKNKPKKNPPRKNNKINNSKLKDEFKKKLKSINHYIYDEEKIKLNPSNNSRYDAFIEIHNNAIVKNEQNEISKEFKHYLKKSTKIIDEKEIEKLKIKYNKDYHDFFTALNMEKSINKHNKNLEKKQKVEVLAILRQKYSSSNSPVSKAVASDLITKYPTIDWNQLIQKYNKQYFNNKYRKTEDDVFYLNDYIRKDDWDCVDSKRANTSKEILKYKDGIPKFLNKFTDQIIEFIEDFSNYGVDDAVEKIFLVSIPSSTPQRNKNSSMKKTIKIIENKYNCGREIINFSNALVRVEDVKTAHVNSNDRPKYEDHIRTIEFSNEQEYNFKNSVFLVLDDITTTGTIMRACEDIISKNIEKDKIYKLAIAATAWDYNE